MREWPPITEPELLERLALDDEGFVAFMRELAAAIPPREFDRAKYEWALGYPWQRPKGSYLLRDEEVGLLEEMSMEKRKATVGAFTGGRHPLLSFGANAAPSRLAAKFAHFEDDADREALVLTGDLHGVDVGAVASPGILGYMPATLFASPETAVRAAVVWVTADQATQLAWSELTYQLGCLEEARFEMDEADVEIEDLFAFVARLGAFCIDGSPVAMAAIPAKGRTAPAMTQEELLDEVAMRVLGPDARAEELVRAVFDDITAVMRVAADTVWPFAQQLQSRWTPLPSQTR
ncbi:MAG TPA: hypothetical protein VGF04_01285 [Solirubrobacterales bacterium]